MSRAQNRRQAAGLVQAKRPGRDAKRADDATGACASVLPRSRRGDTISPVIMWIGVVLAVLIAATWFITTVRPANQDVNAAEHDLAAIRVSVERACTSTSYTRNYNPRTEKGYLWFNSTRACLNTTTVQQCTQLTCALPERTFDLSALTTITITGQAGVVQVN